MKSDYYQVDDLKPGMLFVEQYKSMTSLVISVVQSEHRNIITPQCPKFVTMLVVKDDEKYILTQQLYGFVMLFHRSFIVE